MSLACTQELRAAVSKFRESSADETTDSSGRRRFTLAIADTFGEGLPVSQLHATRLYSLFSGTFFVSRNPDWNPKLIQYGLHRDISCRDRESEITGRRM